MCWGVDGETGCLADMSVLGIWEPLAVKAQTYKTAVEVRHDTSDSSGGPMQTVASRLRVCVCVCVQTAILLLRIDDIVSGHKKKDKDGQTGGQGAE